MSKMFPISVLLSVVNMNECGETAFVESEIDQYPLYAHLSLPQKYWEKDNTESSNARMHELEIIGRKIQNQHPTLVLPYTEMQLFFALKRAFVDMEIPFNNCHIPTLHNKEYEWIWHAIVKGFVKRQEHRLGFGLYPIEK